MTVAYDDGVLFGTAVLASVGIVSNLFCVWHNYRCFSIRKAVFLLLLVNSLISCFCCCVLLGCCIFQDDGFASCVVLLLSYLVPFTMGNFITMEISVLRLHSVRLSLRNETMDERTTSRNALLLMSLPLLYIGGLYAFGAANDLPFSFMVETCLHGDEADMPSSLFTLGYAVPFYLYPLVSLACDAAIVRILRKNKTTLVKCHGSRSSSSGIHHQQDFNTVPVRATVMSACSLLPPLLISLILSFSRISRVKTVSASMMVQVLVVIIRSPALTFVSFSYMSRRADMMKRETREMRLKRVLKFADEERSQMRSSNESAATLENHVVPDVSRGETV